MPAAGAKISAPSRSCRAVPISPCPASTACPGTTSIVPLVRLVSVSYTHLFLSLCGGLLSLLVMAVLYYVVPVRPTWFILSVCGALAHNVGQLLGAGVIISSSLSLYYAPVMLVLGLVMGALTSITLKALLPALGRLGFSTREKRGE